MAFLSLKNIKFSPTISPKKIASDNKKINNPFEGMDIKRYPEDLGTSPGRGHYIQFFINVQRKTQFKDFKESSVPSVIAIRDYLDQIRGAGTSSQGLQQLSTFGTDVSSAVGNVLNAASNLLPAGAKKAVGNFSSILNQRINQTVQGIGSTYPQLTSGISELKNQGTESLENLQQGIRKITQTNTAIALYMPDNLLFNYSHNFNTVDQKEILGRNASAVLQLSNSIRDGLKAGNGSTVAKNMSPFISELISDKYSSFLSGIVGRTNVEAMFNAFTGTVQNPSIELLYYSTPLRSFNFDFQFTPRSSKEAEEVLEIIRLFKFHAAPEILKDSSGRFLVPPSEFDIKFYYNGAENLNIPRITTCVLQSVSVNYAPNGFSAYELVDSPIAEYGGTGMPVAIRMSLQFQETQVITKELLDKDKRDVSLSSNPYFYY